MRKRMIDPGIWTDEKILELEPIETIIFIGLITTADDEGRLKGSSKVIKATILPMTDNKVDEIEKILAKLHELGMIIRYEVNKQPYIQIANWNKYQKVQHPTPSLLPFHENFNNPHESSREIHEDYNKVHETINQTHEDYSSLTPQDKTRQDKQRQDKIRQDSIELNETFVKSKKNITKDIAVKDAVASVVLNSKSEEEIIKQLVIVGVGRERATLITRTQIPELIQRQLTWLPYRHAQNPPAMLIKAIEEEWEEPEEYRKQQTKEQRQANYEEAFIKAKESKHITFPHGKKFEIKQITSSGMLYYGNGRGDSMIPLADCLKLGCQFDGDIEEEDDSDVIDVEEVKDKVNVFVGKKICESEG